MNYCVMQKDYIEIEGNLKSKYLIEGAIVELKDGTRGLILDNHILFSHIRIPLDDYDADMINMNTHYQDIIKVFKLKTSLIRYGLEDVFYDENLDLLWEKLNFEKLKVGDLIMVRDGEGDDWIVRHFVRYDGKNIYVLSEDLRVVIGWNMAKTID